VRDLAVLRIQLKSKSKPKPSS